MMIWKHTKSFLNIYLHTVGLLKIRKKNKQRKPVGGQINCITREKKTKWEKEGEEKKLEDNEKGGKKRAKKTT